MEYDQPVDDRHLLEAFPALKSIRAHVRINENERNDPRETRNYFYDSADQIPDFLPCANPHCSEGQLDLKSGVSRAIANRQEYVHEQFNCESVCTQQLTSAQVCCYFYTYELWLTY